MTLTLTTEEIEKFAAAVGDWSVKRSQFVLMKFFEQGPRWDCAFERGAPKEFLDKLTQQFETLHPPPDWRMLL